MCPARRAGIKPQESAPAESCLASKPLAFRFMATAGNASCERLLAEARERFEEAEDFTVSVEEEFALLDPETLDLVSRFEEVHAAARETVLEPHLVGELIASEVEVKTGKQQSFADVPGALAERRAQLAALVDPLGLS